MPWRDLAVPARMQRVALVCPDTALRDVLVRVADAGVVEIDEGPAPPPGTWVDAPTTHLDTGVTPLLRPTVPDLDALASEGRADLLAGEAALRSRAAGALRRGDVAALVGWVPVQEVPGLVGRLAGTGAGVVPLPSPRGVDPPTLLADGGRARGSFTALVETYGTVPYADVDPRVLAGVAYMLMFGMMFGDAGHGALLVAAGLLLRAGRPRRLARVVPLWPFVVGSGAFAVVFGLLYGEFFGPTGVVPVLWLAPLEEPVTLMVAALGVGAVLLAGAQLLGTLNRWREGGWPLALSAPSGVAGVALLGGFGLLALGGLTTSGWALPLGVFVMVVGVALAAVGFYATSGGGGTGLTQTAVEVFDAVLRVGTNLVSFARLAAFGLTHAAIGAIVWDGSTALWASGGLLVVAAVAVFVLGNAAAFALEALVAGVQALRLEYYELFSRVFDGEGRPFRPWHVPTEPDPARGAPGVPAPSTAPARRPS